MLLDSISILNYRSVSSAELALSPKINCFIGCNGVGKTNLLDAIYYLSFCKSAIASSDSQHIKHGEPFFMIQGAYVTDKGVNEEFSCGLKRGEKKQFKRNKKSYDKLSDHIGLVPLVMISPADYNLISGGSEERRRFMDVVISQYDKEYMLSLMRYNRALLQRNVMLRGDRELDPEMMELVEMVMVEEAARVYEGRLRFVERLIPIFQFFYNEIAGVDEIVTLSYRSSLADGDYARRLVASRYDDRRVGYTTVGVHKDDLVMQLNGYPIKKEGSQGQNKSYLVALKLAQFDFLHLCSGETPILLLDDIFDKLDSRRVEQIVRLVSGERFGQIFITDVNRDHIDSILECIDGGYSLFEVSSGGVQLVKGK
jgi:DNA replication and repair protein RecF